VAARDAPDASAIQALEQIARSRARVELVFQGRHIQLSRSREGDANDYAG
jgi:hypothetical protein